MIDLCDSDHALVQQTAQDLVSGAQSTHEALHKLFQFVRDDIKFAFPPEGDFVKASQTIERGYGQCNTKSILFLALCRASSIPARIHYSNISKEIQHGFFSGLAYWLMPNKLTHSWLEVRFNGQWHSVDTYINDLQLHNAAVGELERRGWQTGFSVSRANGEPSAELSFEEEQYSQMGAVSDDYGLWDDPAEFLYGPHYLNKTGPVRQMLYRLFLPLVNRRVRQLRLAVNGP